MHNKLINFIQNSNETRYFIIGLLLAVMQFIAGHFSVFLWAAVSISIIPVLLGLPFFNNKMDYDLKLQISLSALFFSALSWSLFMWKDLQDFPQSYAVIFVVLTTTGLILFDSLNKKLAVVIPVALTFVFLVIVVMTPSAYILAVEALVFPLLFLYFKNSTAQQKNIQTNSIDEENQTAKKLQLIAEIDDYKIENQELKDKIKQIDIDLSAAEMAKMEFLATMSHEIRTPLNGIIPLLDILLDSELSDFQKDYLSTAHVSAIQMQKLIDDLLDYSKVEAGKLTVEVRGLKTPRILAAVKSSYRQAAEKKNLNIKIEVANNVSPLLRGDPTRLRQVLSNLVSNAIKFSTRGTITLSAKKIKDFPNKEIIRFEVIDQGIGLDKETSDSIFLPFTQEDGSSTRKFGGTGLGLAISKKIVELMNGSIAVESSKGKGSNFYFDLPLLKSVGETSIGATDSNGYQAILINTNPLMFNKISLKLKTEDISFQKALGLTQAYEIYASINKMAANKKNILIFIDFETAGKQVRSLCNDITKDNSMPNLYACILTNSNKIAGIPISPKIKLLSKDDSIPEMLNHIEVMQATAEADAQVVKESQDEIEIQEKQEEEQQIKILENISNIIPEILLVEDNEVNLKVAEKLIQYIGYPFDFAMNGQEALEKVKQNRYRMILMDCQMPVMDGYRCTSKVRDYESAAGLNRTPILAMTANAMMGDREKCLDAGMDDYMSKPLNRYILEKTLKKWDPLIQASEIVNSFEPNEVYKEEPKEETQKEDAKVEVKTETVIEETPQLPKEDKVGAVATEISQISESLSAPEDNSQENVKTLESKNESAPAPEPQLKPKVEINQKWLNTKSLDDIKEFMGDEIVQLLEMFEQETPTILKKMRTALSQNNYEEAGKMAHMLKSTSANIGGNGLSFFSRKMELAATDSKHSELPIIFNKIKKAYSLTSAEIKKYISMQ
jgi:signal transduction histidine kinase/CheY-like chemotaxis protein/HPt (histidine-containing phosphotransfer) domain-containing protein